MGLGKVGLIFSGKVLGRAFSFIAGFLIIRYLSPREYGMFSASLTLLDTFVVPFFSIAYYVVARFAPLYEAGGEWGRLKGLFGFSLVYFLLSTLVMAALSAVLGLVYKNGEYFFYVVMHGISLGGGTAMRTFYAFAVGLREVYLSTFLLDVLPSLLYLAVVSSLVFFPSVLVVFLAIIVRYYTSSLSLAFEVFTLLKDRIKNVRASYQFRKWLAYGGPATANVVWEEAFNSARVVLLDLFLGAVSVAFFRVPMFLMPLFKTVYNSLLAVVFPDMVRAVRMNDGEILALYVRRFMRVQTVFVSLAVAVSIVLFGREILAFLKPVYVKSYGIMVVLGMAVVLEYLSSPLKRFLLAHGRSDYVFLSGILSSTFNLSLFALAVRLYGLMGGAVAYVIGQVFYTLVVSFFCWKISGRGVWRLYDPLSVLLAVLTLGLSVLRLLSGV